MKQPISHATIINLEHFPDYARPTAKEQLVGQISGYLEKLLAENMAAGSNYLELPSFSDLSTFFGCSYLEVYDAFRSLRTSGRYDYQFSSLDGSVLVWQKATREMTNNKGEKP